MNLAFSIIFSTNSNNSEEILVSVSFFRDLSKCTGDNVKTNLSITMKLDNHKLILSHERGQMWLESHPLFTPRLMSVFELIQHFTVALPLKCHIISIINGHIRLRMKLIV